MNENYFCIEFESELGPSEMLTRLRARFPDAKWHGSDTDTQGPSLSSLAKAGPKLKIFFEGERNSLCMSFGSVKLADSELNSYKDEFVGYVRKEVLPLIASELPSLQPAPSDRYRAGKSYRETSAPYSNSQGHSIKERGMDVGSVPRALKDGSGNSKPAAANSERLKA